MKIFIGSDHAGFELKEKLKFVVADMGHDVTDKGPFALDPGDDYPDFCAQVAREVENNAGSMGIVLGGSSVGEAIVANRFKGIRAVAYYGGNIDLIKLSREHNDCNVLSLGARLMPDDEAEYAVKMWLKTPFSNEERHARRIKKIDQLM